MQRPLCGPLDFEGREDAERGRLVRLAGALPDHVERELAVALFVNLGTVRITASLLIGILCIYYFPHTS